MHLGRLMRGVQVSEKPSAPSRSVDPDTPWGGASLATKASGGTLPSEAYQYDAVLELFQNDKDFFQQWNVKGWARTTPGDSAPASKICIRVVMGLPRETDLPKSYHPSATSAGALGSFPYNDAHFERLLATLPSNHSVPLDVVTLEEARTILASQRALRGQVASRYNWLEDIVRRVDNLEDDPRPAPRSKQKAARSLKAPPQLAVDLDEAQDPPPLSDILTPFSDDFGSEGKTAGTSSCALGRRQVLEECRFVDEFGSRMSLRPREPTTSTKDVTARSLHGAMAARTSTMGDSTLLLQDDDELEEHLRGIQARARISRGG